MGLAEEMLGGVLVTPSDFLLNLISGGVTVTSTDTNYVDSNGNHILSKNTDGVTCTPAFPYTLPLLVKGR